MIGPQSHQEAYFRDFAGRIDRGPGSDRPPPEGSTIWWVVKVVVLVGLVLFSCVGFAGAQQSASRHCNEIGRQACLGLVVDDLLGEPLPVRPAGTAAD